MKTESNFDRILSALQAGAKPANKKSMARFAIKTEHALGIRLPDLRQIARQYRHQHQLALALFKHPLRETRILASMIAEPKETTIEQMEQWMKEFNDWEIVDQCCFNLFWQTETAYENCFRWSKLQPEFEKRTAFSLMAKLSISDKKLLDTDFEAFFPVILRESNDQRIYVKKAVNWALRQIGKRNKDLLLSANKTARELSEMKNASARWIGKDAQREFKNKFPEDIQ